MKTALKFLPFLLLTACINLSKDESGVEVSVGKDKNSLIRNGIKVEEHGLKVEQAFLLYDDNTLVPESNEAKVHQDILCRLIISGWKEKEGKVFPGASEKIASNTGEIALNEEDLFSSYDSTGVAPKDAEYITLSAVITKIDKLYDYFEVTFKVWDKVGQGYVNGSFRFKVK